MKKKNLSEFKEITQLIRKTKKLMREELKTVQIEEPVLQMIYDNKRVKYFEGVKSGTYEFEKSNGETGSIELDSQFLLTFPIGKDIFRSYLCYEHSPFPLPQKPLVYAEQWNASIQKIMNDKADYKRGVYSDRGEMWFKILKGLAMLIGAILGIKLLAGLVGVDINIPFIDQQATETIQQVSNNITTTVFQ